MRYRIRWAKRGKLRFLSHHDEALVVERAVRRGRLPLAYSQGFTPHPKISYGSGLPVGVASEVELLDLTLTEDIEPGHVVSALDEGLPDGLAALGAAPVEPGSPSLASIIRAADYEVTTDAEWLASALERFLALDAYEIVKPYKGRYRKDDLRAGLLGAEVSPSGCKMRCSLHPRAIRPADVFAALEELAGAARTTVSYRRVALLTESDGVLVPLTEHQIPEKVNA